jgi:hypothetical protein
MTIFENNTFEKLSTDDRMTYTLECFPIGSKIDMLEEYRNKYHYIEGVFEVIGYNTNSMDDPLLEVNPNYKIRGNNTIHPRFVKLDTKYIRNEKLNEILK